MPMRSTWLHSNLATSTAAVETTSPHAWTCATSVAVSAGKRVGPAPFWGPRRGSRDPGIHYEVPGVGFVWIWARSCAVLAALLEGWYPANATCSVANAQAERHQ